MRLMNSSKNKLNSEISWQKLFLPNGYLGYVWVCIFTETENFLLKVL